MTDGQPAVEPSIDADVTSLDAIATEAVTDGSNSPIRTELFGTSVLNAVGVADPDAVKAYEESKADQEEDSGPDKQDAKSIFLTNDNTRKLFHELQATGSDGLVEAMYAKEEMPGVWINRTTGKKFTSDEVSEARMHWFEDPSAFAAAFWYEINKASSGDEHTEVMERTFELLNEAMSKPEQFSDDDVAGILSGAGIVSNYPNLSLKNMAYNINEAGLYEYKGINALKFIEEMATKFRDYEMAGFRPVDIANLAFMTEAALRASIEYKDSPASPEFIKSQFILQRASKIVSDMRYGSTVDSKGDDAAVQMGAKGMLTRPAIRIGKEDKQIYLDGQPLRAGSATVAGAGWDQVAGFTDVACSLFPNLKYVSREELSPLDKVVADRQNEAVETANPQK